MKSDTVVIIEAPGKYNVVKNYFPIKCEVYATKGNIFELPFQGTRIINEYGDIELVLIPKAKKFSIDYIFHQCKRKKVFILTDNDDEGEFIAFQLKNILIRTELEKIYRLRCNGLSHESLVDGYMNLEKEKGARIDIDDRIVRRCLVRKIIDKSIGLYYSSRLKKDFKINNLYIGRVKVPVLKYLVENKNKYYYNGSCVIGMGYTGLEKYEIELKSSQVLHNRLQGWYKISKVRAKRKNIKKPITFMSALKRGVGLVNINDGIYRIKKVYSTLQGLYERGILSYIRTRESVYSDLTVKKSMEKLRDVPIKLEGLNTIKQGVMTHGGIVPLYLIEEKDMREQEVFNELERKILEEIEKMFIEALRMDEEYEVEVDIDDGRVNGKIRGNKNFLDKIRNGMYIYVKVQPNHPLGRLLDCLDFMERNNLGTPSTYVNIISDLAVRGLLDHEYFTVTELGERVSDWCNKNIPWLTKDISLTIESLTKEISDAETVVDVIKKLKEQAKELDNVLSLKLEEDEEEEGVTDILNLYRRSIRKTVSVALNI